MAWFGKRKQAAPPPEPEKPEAPHDEHGLVEELVEEIQEAVEHVPEPVRWTVGKLVRLGLLVLASLIIIAIASVILYLGNRTELVAHELTLFLNTTLARRSNVQVEISDIRGNPFRHVRLISPVVRFTDEGDAPPFLEAPWIDLSYEPLSLLPWREPRIRIRASSPVLTITRRADGTLRLPTWRVETAAAERKGPGRDLDVRLIVDDATAHLPRPLDDIHGMKLDVSARTGGGTLVRVNTLWWKDGPYHTRRLDVAGSLWFTDSVRLDLERARTTDVALKATGRWPAGGGPGNVEIEVEKLPWRWLAQVTGNKSFDATGSARGVVRATMGEDARGSFDVTADWNELPVVANGGFAWAKQQLTLAPLRGRSPAGDLVGDVRWSHAGWEVGGAAKKANPARWGAIGIPDWPTGELQGNFRYAVDTRARAPVAKLDATLGPSMLEGWNVDGGRVAVRFPPSGPDSFMVDVNRRGGTLLLRGAAGEGGWTGDYRLARYPLDEWPDGRASGLTGLAETGSGSVTSRNGVLAVDGTMSGTSLSWFGAKGQRWTLDHMQGALLPKPDLKIEARSEEMSYLGVDFDSVRIFSRVGEAAARLDSVTAFAGDTLVRIAGDVGWRADGWTMTLDRAQATSSQFAWTGAAPVVLAGDARGVDFRRFEASDGEARLVFEGRWATANGGRYDWRARADSLDLSRIGLPPEWGLAGKTSATLEVTGSYQEPHWTLHSATKLPGWGGHHGERLSLALSGGPGRLNVDEAEFTLAGGTLRARGRFDETATRWPSGLTGDEVMRWLSEAGRWEGEARATEFPVEGLRHYSAQAAGWTGRVGGRVTVGGRPGDPTFDAEFEGRPLAWRGLGVEAVEARARYADERLDVPEIRVTRGGRASTARGQMPIRLALGKQPETLDRPMDWRLDVPNGDLGWIAALVPQFGTASGDFGLVATVAGTPRAPDLHGSIRVQNGILRMAGREETFTQVRAALRMSKDKITLDSLTARQGQTGTVQASGEIEVKGMAPDHYRFEVRMRDCSALESGVYAVRFDGNFVVTDGPRLGTLWLPRIEGNLRVREAVILLDFANQSENQQLAATAAPLYWTYRVQVTATHRLFWRPPDGDVEFNANLNVEQTPKELIIYGEMRALRGTYYFLSNRYDVTRAELTFDNVQGINPRIVAEAVTQVVPLAGSAGGLAVGSDNGKEEVHRVTVRIEGRTKEPLITLSSDPSDWGEARILRELTLGRFAGNAATGLGDPIDHYLTRAINRTLSSEMSRVFSGYVDQWALDRERGGLFGGEGELILGVGTRVTPNLQVRYRQRVPGMSRSTRQQATTTDPLERDLEAEYRLSRFFYVSSELVQRRQLSGTTGTTRPEFNVNLKARWEY